MVSEGHEYLYAERSAPRAPRYALTPSQRHDVSRQQVEIVFGVLPWAAVGHIVITTGLAAFVIPPGVGAYLALWPLVNWIVGSIGLFVGVQFRRELIAPSYRGGLFFLLAMFVAVGFSYSTFALVLYPKLDDSGDLVLTAVVAAVIGAGALVTATLQAVGIMWILSSTVILGIGFWLQPEDEFTRLFVALIAYAGALVGGTVAVSSNLRTRHGAELSAASERAVAQLLIDDFEGGAGDFVWETNQKGKFTRIPMRLAIDAGVDPESIVGEGWRDLFAQLETVEIPGGIDALMQLQGARADFAAFVDVVVPVRILGEVRWWQVSGRPRPGRTAGEHVWRGVGSDVTEVKMQSDEIVRMGKIDALTGMPNRHSFWTEFEQLLDSTSAGDNRIAFAMLDLDNFKSVNDALGHTVGDAVLREVGDRLSGVREPSQVLARLGGDEFAILFSGVNGRSLLQESLARYSETLLEPIVVNGIRLEIGCSIGYYFPSERSTSVDAWIAAADLALFAAKEAGRGAVREYAPWMTSVAERRTHLLEDLGNAVAKTDLELALVPRIEVETREIVGVEVSVTWNNHRLGAVPSAEFLAVAEDTGLADPLGASIVELACEAAARFPDHVCVAVCVSTRQLESDSFVGVVETSLRRSGVNANRLELQLDESATIADASKSAILAIAGLGVSLTVGDFGAGFTSLASLSGLPFSRVQISGSISDAAAGDAPILVALVGLVEALGMDVVVSGVETEEHLRAVAQAGVRTAQVAARYAMSVDEVVRAVGVDHG